MTFDALTMHAVRDQLETSLLSGLVEKVVPLADLEVGLRIHSRHRDFNLLISADPQAARVHLVEGTLRRLSDEVTPFHLLLRKYVRDGRIVAISQPALERVMRLDVEKRQDDGSITRSSLIIEIMGRHSNVILVGVDGQILDAIKRVPPSLSRLRPVLPHLLYSPPPPTDKLNPMSPILGRQLAAAARQSAPSSPLWRLLQEAVAGLGPLSAREVAYRALGDAAAQLSAIRSWEPVVERLQELLQPLESREWSPSVVLEGETVLHYAPFPITQFPGSRVERVESISLAVERAYADRLRLRPGEALRGPLRASIEARLERVRRREESLRNALARGEKAEELKLKGQAILASMSRIQPGDAELMWEGQRISLDPRLSPSDNAQRYFRDYAKARDAVREVPALLESARLEREYLEQMLTMAELADGEVELRALARELAEASQEGSGGVASGEGARPKREQKARRDSRKKVEQPAGTFKRLTSSEGHTILVGGSARGNERVTFDLASGNDLWFHARGVPGAHVILKVGSSTPSERALLEAAGVAALRSQARGSGKVLVDYTPQRYVKKVKGGPHGLVTYSNERTVRVDATAKPGSADGE